MKDFDFMEEDNSSYLREGITHENCFGRTGSTLGPTGQLFEAIKPLPASELPYVAGGVVGTGGGKSWRDRRGARKKP